VNDRDSFDESARWRGWKKKIAPVEAETGGRRDRSFIRAASHPAGNDVTRRSLSARRVANKKASPAIAISFDEIQEPTSAPGGRRIHDARVDP